MGEARARPHDDETDVGIDASHLVGLLDLTNRTCRWPVGSATGSAQMFCGLPANLVEHGPYCPMHTKKAGPQR
jgi:hypothetical protein